MLDALNRLFNWSAMARGKREAALSHARRLDVNGTGRRVSGFSTVGAIGPETAAAGPMARSRARGLFANNAHVRNGVENLVGSIVGTGITPTGLKAAVDHWHVWAPFADADSVTDINGLMAAAVQGMIVDGETFVQIIADEDGIRLRLLPPEMVDESKTVELSGGGYVVNGIEFDASGRRVAYWILPSKPTNHFAIAPAAIRVDAADILHIRRPIGAGQVRGLSWLAPIVVSANEFDAIVDALALGMKIAAMHAGFLVDMNGTGEPYDGTETGGILESGLEPGTLKRLPTGFDVKFNSPQQASEIGSFLRFNLQMLAAGLGVPEHLLSGDLSQANYSSLRAGLIPFRQRCEQIVYHTLVPQLLNPLWARVQLFGGDPSAQAEWLPPAWAQVDPLKAVQATVAEIGAGLTSRAKAVAERGWSIETLDAEIAADRQREESLGLAFGAQPAAQEPDDEPDAQKKEVVT